MTLPVVIYADMADGSVLVEHAADFRQFVAIVLPLRRDPECVAVEWRQDRNVLAADDTRGDAEEAEYLLLEGRDSNPLYQSNDLDEELADAQLDARQGVA